MQDKKPSAGQFSGSIRRIREGLTELENAIQGIENAAGDEARWLVHTCANGRFLLDMRSLVDRTVRDNGQWEQDQLDYLLQIVRDNYADNYDLVFFDIGAYLGWYAVSALSSGLFSEIHAFEANPQNYAQLNANIMLNDALKSVHLHHCVVTDEEGSTPVSLPIRERNRGWAEVASSGGFTPDFKVPNLVLDQRFAAMKGRFLVAKIDVEGHEQQVLSGMMKLCANNDCVLQVEVYKKSRPLVVSALQDAGFELLGEIQEDLFFVKCGRS